MHESIRFVFFVACAISISTSAYIFFYEEDITTTSNDYEFVFSDDRFYSELEIYMNNSWKNDTSIVIHNSNGTEIFRGDWNNETLMNTTLYLEINFREFIYLIMPTFQNNTFLYTVFEQIAEQLKE